MTTAQSAQLLAFYHVTAIEDWTCYNVTNYYNAKMEQKERKKILDRIKKDLQTVEESNLFDVLRKRKAREILDDWKCSTLSASWDYSSEGMTSNSDELFVRRLAQAGLFVCSDWVSSRSLENGSDNAFVNVGHLHVNQLNQLATGSCATLHDNRCMKHHRDSNNEEEIPSTEEVTAPSKKIKTTIEDGERRTPSERIVEDKPSGSAEEVSPDKEGVESDNVEFTDSSLSNESKKSSKMILSWKHVAEKIIIDRSSDHDWIMNGYNISEDF
ncbi:17524_t:CDS:2, partial [Funneliformis caledonium]